MSQLSSPAAGFNRWRIPPAALAVHLSIGMVYGFSVFWLPMSRLIGGATAKPCAEGLGIGELLFAADCDWKISWLSVTFTLFFVFLGASAALFGARAERAGPRKSAFVAACCWGGGLALAASGVHLHQIWLLWLGAGVVGGVGLGLGYISPVSALLKWFPDHKGMAAGLAIMGFGGGAMIGAPLADLLMKFYADPITGAPGVAATLLTLACVHFVAMSAGAAGYRTPPAQTERPSAEASAPRSCAPYVAPEGSYAHVSDAWKTPQFALVWGVLFCNVTAGVGVLGMASPMFQEIFGGKLIGIDAPLSALTSGQAASVAAVAAGFTGALSLFNICGRFFWASVSDRLGRKTVFMLLLSLGGALYAVAPWAGGGGHVALFILCFCGILSMYGGGFALAPAYLADLFGTKMVGAIHGRLLTAWSLAAVAGPMLVSMLRERAQSLGLPEARGYDVTLYVLSGILAAGFGCNLLVKRVNAARLRSVTEEAGRGVSPVSAARAPLSGGGIAAAGGSVAGVLLMWTSVALPLAWGVWMTLKKIAPLLGG